MPAHPHPVSMTAAAIRVGIVSDTHLPESRADLWPHAYDWLSACDLIIHGGDIHEMRYLDHLSALAPTYAARGNGEEGNGYRPTQPHDDRCRPSWLLAVGPALIGVLHDAPVPGSIGGPTLAETLDAKFGRRDLDVLIHGHTHVESIRLEDDVLCVNPGSPTYPHNLRTQLGTLGELVIREDHVEVNIVQLTEDGVVPFDWGERDVHTAPHHVRDRER